MRPTVFLMAMATALLTAAEVPHDQGNIGHDAEEAYELRLEIMLKKSGPKAMLAWLQEEQGRDTRVYAQAWVAWYQIYGDTLGVPEVRDETRGFAAAEAAAKAGSLVALELLGRAHGDGRTPDKRRNAREAVRLLQAAAEAGRYTAMGELAKFHYFGAGTAKDLTQAESWARRAAYRGYPGMLMNFGDWAREGAGGGKPDHDRAAAYYAEAASRGVKPATEKLRKLASTGNQEAKLYARLWFLDELTKGADLTTSRIRSIVAELEKGWPDDVRMLIGVGQVRMERDWPVFDARKAREQLQRAAAMGSLEASYHLTEMQRRGIGEKKNGAEAARRLEELARQGNPRAMSRLGWLHYWGADSSGLFPKDPDKAFQWSRDAAHAGDAFSILNVAHCYTHGIGTSANPAMAARYYSIAEDLGYIEAIRGKNAALAFIKD